MMSSREVTMMKEETPEDCEHCVNRDEEGTCLVSGEHVESGDGLCDQFANDTDEIGEEESD